MSGGLSFSCKRTDVISKERALESRSRRGFATAHVIGASLQTAAAGDCTLE